LGQFQRSQRERSHNTLLRYNCDSHYDHALCRYALFCVTTHYNLLCVTTHYNHALAATLSFALQLTTITLFAATPSFALQLTTTALSFCVTAHYDHALLRYNSLQPRSCRYHLRLHSNRTLNHNRARAATLSLRYDCPCGYHLPLCSLCITTATITSTTLSRGHHSPPPFALQLRLLWLHSRYNCTLTTPTLSLWLHPHYNHATTTCLHAALLCYRSLLLAATLFCVTDRYSTLAATLSCCCYDRALLTAATLTPSPPPRSCVATARCYTVLPLRPRPRGYTLTLTTVPWLTACLPPHPLVLRLHPCCGHALVATYTLALPMITLFDLFVSPGFYPNLNERKPTYGILSSFFFSSLPSFFHFFQSNTSAQHCVIVRGVVARRAEL